MKKNRPEIIAFDVIETLFSLAPIADRLVSVGLQRESLPVFFSRILRDAFALESSRVYKPFRHVAAAALEVMIASSGTSPEHSDIESVLESFTELPAHEDVEAGLEAARSSGFRLITLTNGSAENTQKLLSRAALAKYFERTICIDEIHHWKPSREVYLYAAQKMSVVPERMALIAAHAWDTHGASQAGLVSGWLRRQEKEFPSSMTPPDVRGDTLEMVVRNLSSLKSVDAA
jgi:2-haloacid dehalogenase